MPRNQICYQNVYMLCIEAQSYFLEIEDWLYRLPSRKRSEAGGWALQEDIRTGRRAWNQWHENGKLLKKITVMISAVSAVTKNLFFKVKFIQSVQWKNPIFISFYAIAIPKDDSTIDWYILLRLVWLSIMTCDCIFNLFFSFKRCHFIAVLFPSGELWSFLNPGRSSSRTGWRFSPSTIMRKQKSQWLKMSGM